MANQNEIVRLQSKSQGLTSASALLGGVSFADLCNTIRQIDEFAVSSSTKAINQMLTTRNWLIGAYIVEYEQMGNDRAQYGATVLLQLAERLHKSSLSYRNLYVFRQFYLSFPQLFAPIQGFVGRNLILQSPIAKLVEVQRNNLQSLPAESNIPEVPADKLFSSLSFTHFVQLLPIEDSLARTFYEYEAIRGAWSVRELKRQIGTNAYFRSGISASPEKMSEYIQAGAEKAQPQDIIKMPYVFEFLGLKAKEVVSEGDLESALIDHLQEFLLELGKGFCFEARQPRIMIDDEYYYPDLVFYNRLLHCHVIVELKDETFSHENLGQLNAYVSYYRENEMSAGDRAPIGILLCTKQGKKMVEYALAGLDNQLFVSTYMLQLPEKAQLEQFLYEQLKQV